VSAKKSYHTCSEQGRGKKCSCLNKMEARKKSLIPGKDCKNNPLFSLFHCPSPFPLLKISSLKHVLFYLLISIQPFNIKSMI